MRPTDEQIQAWTAGKIAERLDRRLRALERAWRDYQAKHPHTGQLTIEDELLRE